MKKNKDWLNKYIRDIDKVIEKIKEGDLNYKCSHQHDGTSVGLLFSFI